MLPYFNFKCTVRFICFKHMLIIRMIYLNSSKCSHLIWQSCYYQVLHSWKIDLFWKLAWKIESQNYPLQQILFESLNSHRHLRNSTLQIRLPDMFHLIVTNFFMNPTNFSSSLWSAYCDRCLYWYNIIWNGFSVLIQFNYAISLIHNWGMAAVRISFMASWVSFLCQKYLQSKVKVNSACKRW